MLQVDSVDSKHASSAMDSISLLTTLCGAILVCFVAGGASCARRELIQELQPPIVFESSPSLANISEHINHSLAIERIESNSLTISSPEIVTKLRGALVWERPHNFSLEAYPGSRLLGTALAAGSNADMFWLQTQTPSPPTLYFARHSEFQNQAGPKKILPVSPLWLREAMGIVEFDPGLAHDEPIRRADGKLEVRSYIPSPQGAYRRHLILDGQKGTIEQTILYNPSGKLVAVAHQSEHEYFTAIDYSLPHRIDIQLQPDEGPVLSFTVEVAYYAINEAASTDYDQFQPPDNTGLTTVNLVHANATAAPTTALPPTYTQAPTYGRQGTLINWQRMR